MECPKCKKQYELESSDMVTNVKEDSSGKSIDLQIFCPHCGELAAFKFVSEQDLINAE